MAFISEAINSRVAATLVLQIWAMPLLIALYTFDLHTSSWAYFAVVSLIAAYPYVHPIQVAWASRNSSSVRTRSVLSRIHGGELIRYQDHFCKHIQHVCSDGGNHCGE